VHGIYRAQTPEIRARRELFIHELLVNVEVYAFTQETALLAGKIDGEQQARGITVPFSDLLIGATALLHGYSVLTVNVRDFRKIPGLSVLSL
jgi:predicted nucleic acid-binding protein